MPVKRKRYAAESTNVSNQQPNGDSRNVTRASIPSISSHNTLPKYRNAPTRYAVQNPRANQYPEKAAAASPAKVTALGVIGVFASHRTAGLTIHRLNFEFIPSESLPERRTSSRSA